MDERREWLHTTDVADALGVAPETVRRWIRSRRLRATVLVYGSRMTYRVRRTDFDRFRSSYLRDTLSDEWE